MILQVKNKRKDGKYTVVFAYSNGVRITKILTAEQLKVEKEKAIK